MVYEEVNIKGKIEGMELKSAKNVRIVARAYRKKLIGLMETESTLIALYEVSKLFI